MAAVAVLIVRPSHLGSPDNLCYKGKSVSWWLARLDSPDAEKAQQALRTVGGKAAPLILSKLRHGEVLDVEAITALRALGPDAVPALIKAFDDNSEEVRLAALSVISALRAQTGPYADQLLPALIKLLPDPSPEVRFLAMIGLAGYGPKASPAVAQLVNALLDSDMGTQGEIVNLRGKAAFVLGRIGPAAQSAVPELTKLLMDRDGFTRGQAVVALWRIRHDTNLVKSTLTAMFEEADPATRHAAALALLRIGAEAELGPELKARFAAVQPRPANRPLARLRFRTVEEP